VLTIKAPAKINWFLLVTGKRHDGFHDILSLMQCVSLFDTLSFEPADGISLNTASDIPIEENLVYRAALLMKERTGTRAGARITLDKQIPVSAGLGGGSSDAASTLLGLNDLWGLGLGLERLMELGSKLGSDVPFFVSGGPSLVSGRGEKLEPLLKGPSCTIALIKPQVGVSAGFAYSALKQFSEDTPSHASIKEAIESGEVSDIIPLMKNDLEPPVFEVHPEVLRIKESLLSHGAPASLMSGSGSTVFGAFESEDEAERAVSAVRDETGTDLWSAVVRTI
jgi:4-diphosphocytidyl-2-C-methyl-D-erythritol kinase